MSAPVSGGADDRLARICGIGGISFLIVVILLFLLDRAGFPREIVSYLFVLAALAIYASVGFLSRTASLSEYQIAGRRIPAVFAGVAAGAEWTAAAIILSATGSLFLAGRDGHALLLALTGGYVLAAVLVAPFLRNLGVSTISDFIGARFGNFARLLAVIVLVACSLPLAVAFIQGAVLVIGLGTDTAFYVFIAMIALCTLPGGMRGVATTQVAQYVVLVIGCVALFLIVEAQIFDAPAGSNYDPLLQALQAIARGMGLAPSFSPRSISFSVPEAINDIELVVCLMAGTASLPHILTRSAATPRTAPARAALAWSLLFIGVLVLALPTFFALAGDEAARERSGVVSGLVAVIGLTAMLAAASSVALTLANSLGHDIGHKGLAPQAAPATRLAIARIMLVAVIALIAYAAKILPPEPLSMAAWGFSLAAAGYFPALVLGIWWQRTNTTAAICGMVAGFGLSLFYLLVTRYFPQAGVSHFGMSALLDPANGTPLVDVARVLADPRWLADVPASVANPLASKIGWLNVGNIACGIFGLIAGFLVIIVLSLPGRRSSKEKADIIDALRAPVHERGQKPTD